MDYLKNVPGYGSMILNGKNIGVSKIELNKDELIVVDKSKKYLFFVYVSYDWHKINDCELLKKTNIEFNEYCFSENNEQALVCPSKSVVEKINDTTLCFYFNFKDIFNSVTYMNKRGCFDVKLESLEIKVCVDYKAAIDGTIVYNY